MEPIYIAAFASFSLGVMGYIVVWFWIRPIRRYRHIKKQIALALPAEARASGPARLPEADSAAARRCSAALAACFNDDLPQWYRLWLVRRAESPLEAAKDLLTLANTRNPDHAAQRAARIRESLKLK